jgi:hypothetical protein
MYASKFVMSRKAVRVRSSALYFACKIHEDVEPWHERQGIGSSRAAVASLKTIPSSNRLPHALGSGGCHCSRNDQDQSKEWLRRRDYSITFCLVTVAVTFRKR